MKIRKKVNQLFENKNTQDIILVHFEDLDGLLHYEYAWDGTQQIFKMTWAQLVNEGFERTEW